MVLRAVIGHEKPQGRNYCQENEVEEFFNVAPLRLVQTGGLKISYCRFASAADTGHLDSNIVVFWSCLIRHSVVSRLCEVLAGDFPNRGSNLEQAGRAPKCGLGGFLVLSSRRHPEGRPRDAPDEEETGSEHTHNRETLPTSINEESAADSAPKVN